MDSWTRGATRVRLSLFRERARGHRAGLLCRIRPSPSETRRPPYRWSTPSRT